MLHGHSSNTDWEELPFLDYDVNSYIEVLFHHSLLTGTKLFYKQCSLKVQVLATEIHQEWPSYECHCSQAPTRCYVQYLGFLTPLSVSCRPINAAKANTTVRKSGYKANVS